MSAAITEDRSRQTLYAAIGRATTELIYTQDDDCLVDAERLAERQLRRRHTDSVAEHVAHTVLNCETSWPDTNGPIKKYDANRITLRRGLVGRLRHRLRELRVFLGALHGSASPVRTYTALLGAEAVLEPGAAVEVAIATWEWGSYLGDEGKRNGVRAAVSSWRRISADSVISRHSVDGVTPVDSIAAASTCEVAR